MRVGMFLGQPLASDLEVGNVVDRAVELAGEAADAGVHTVWFGQATSYDAIGLAALVGREVPGVHVGTAVVPVHARHPLLVAAAAKTAQAATSGRFRLGLGLGARLQESVYGVPWASPVPYLREYLSALRPLLAGDDAPYEGEIVASRPITPTAVPGAHPPVPVLVAAMGPRALAVTGELADGTLPHLAGPITLARRIVPDVTRAAAAAGRGAPEVVACVPTVVTDDLGAARGRLEGPVGFHDRVPSYRRIVAEEGLSSAIDLALVGDEDTVATGLRRYVDAGVTELVLTQTDLFDPATRARTWAVATTLTAAPAWSDARLREIERDTELRIAAFREDGAPRRPVLVWSVVHEGVVFVRSWYRREGGWNAAAARRGRARVHLAQGPVDVRAQDVGAADARLRRAVDDAYRRKYGGGAVAGMVSDAAAATTLRLLPAA